MAKSLIASLSKNPTLTDILIQIENFFDEMDLYVFRNWFDGEIVEGPIVERYWVSIVLKYDYDDMPDPTGGLRLLKSGAKVTYQKSTEEVEKPVEDPSDFRSGTKKPKMEEKPIWLIKVSLRRDFIEALDDSMIDDFDDELDADTVSDSRDEGIHAEDQFKTSDSEDMNSDESEENIDDTE